MLKDISSETITVIFFSFGDIYAVLQMQNRYLIIIWRKKNKWIENMVVAYNYKHNVQWWCNVHTVNYYFTKAL